MQDAAKRYANLLPNAQPIIPSDSETAEPCEDTL